MHDVPSAEQMLERIIPFQFLTGTRRRELVERLERRRYQDGDALVRLGELSRDVFLLAHGKVECIDGREPPIVLSTIPAGHYFGERAALFERPRQVTVRAHGEVVAYSLPGRDFLRLVSEVPVFAQALANTLKVKQGIFMPYRRLYARVLFLLDRGELLLSELLGAYRALSPALHPHLSCERIDVGALGYAIARLPETVTTTSFYYMTGSLPRLYRDPDEKMTPIRTKARRRSAWQALPGKTVVLLRDGITDVSDLLTCLCCYAVEAKKVRRRLRSDANLRALKQLVERPDPQKADAFLAGLPLADAELEGLRRIWPVDLCTHLRNMLLHHEDVALECDTPIDDYNSRASEVWVDQIRAKARSLVDLDDPRLEVHIVSSNTHSVRNCLSPYLARHADEILAWGRKHRPQLAGEPSAERPWGAAWRDPRDLLYVTARHYLADVPGAQTEYEREEGESGQIHLDSTAFTGIEVDLFDLSRIDPAASDPGVHAHRPAHPVLLVNVDYAFGQQAEEILANLLFVFGHRVRSVNVLGKAGGLVGTRGDVLIPAATLLQTNDELYPVPNCDLCNEMLAELLPERAIHHGPVLTVAGTLLQDRTLLEFYRKIWKCVGLEMEGSFYARRLISAIATGVAHPDVQARFAYYVSDVPLDPDENLAEAMQPWEGVPPLYAITRAFLAAIFGSVACAPCGASEAPAAAHEEGGTRKDGTQ